MDFIESLPELTLEEAGMIVKGNLLKQKRFGGMPVFLIGTPGRGKSTLMRSIAEELGWEFFDVNLGSIDESFFIGLPFVDKEGRTFWSKPPFVSELEKRAKEKDVLVFLDDFHLVSGEVQKALMELLSARKLSGHEIPKNVYFVLAGNFSPDSGAQVIFSPIFNRIKPIKLTNNENVVLEEFINYVEKTGLVKEMSVLGLVFVESSPSVLVEEERSGVFGSLRSVTDLLVELKIAENNYYGKELEKVARTLIFSSVNEKADSFYEFYSIAVNFKEVPIENPEEIVRFLITNDEKKIPVYTQIASFVVKNYIRNWKKSLLTGENLKESWSNLWRFVEEIQKVLDEKHITEVQAVKKAVYTLYPILKNVIEEFSSHVLSRKDGMERLRKVKEVYKELFGEETNTPLNSFFFRVSEIKIPFVVSGNKVERRSLVDILSTDSFKEKMVLW